MTARMTEAQLHKAVAELLPKILSSVSTWTTFPAGGGGKARGAQLKARGLRAGWPDIQILADGYFIGLELKAQRGSVSDEQKACHDAIESCGGSVHVCRSIEEVRAVLADEQRATGFMILKRGPS